ncbi:MAG: hypothetical protein Q7S00_02265 [bacterium]|nr:hypothetical protein [bacterium]
MGMMTEEQLKNLPEGLIEDPNFHRYWQVWKNDKHSIVFVPLAELFLRYGLKTEAEEICQQGLLLNPNSVSGRMVLARIHLEYGNRDKVQELVYDILTRSPQNEEAKKMMDQLSSGEEEEVDPTRGADPAWEADSAPKKGIAKKSSRPWETVSMAEIYAAQGDSQRARQICESILQGNPANKRAQTMLSRLQTTPQTAGEKQ